MAAFFSVSLLLRAQSCPECRFVSYVFDSVEISTVKFGEGVNADGDLQELYMDIYEPYGDTMAARPVVLFAFGGGFIQGSRDEGYIIRACERFARAGYVAIAMDYRIGFDPLGLFPQPTEELMRVFFRAMQDMRGSIQWARAHADVMGNTLRLDTNRIMIGGASAGAITACMVAYCDKSIEFAEMGDTNAIAGLGGFYSSSGLYPNYSWEANGVFNISGALVNVNWMEPGDPPIFNAHGDEDAVVPYQGGNFGIGPISIGLEGSYNIQQAAAGRGVCSYLYTMTGVGHPSGGEDEEFYDQIFLRALPRAWGGLQGLSFCCPLEVDVIEDQIGTSSGTAVELNADIINGGNTSIRWCDLHAAATATTNPFSYTPDSLTTYAIAMVTEGGCMNTDFAMITEIPVGQAEPGTPQGHLELFPTPVKTSLFLRWEQEGKVEPETVRLFDVHGRYLDQWHWNKGEMQELDLRSYESGIYFVEVEGQGKAYWEKILLVTEN